MTDAGTGVPRHIEAPAAVRRVVLTSGGQQLCGLLAGSRLVRWSAADGRLLDEATYRGPDVTAVAIAPTGDRVAVASADGAVRLLDARTLAVAAEMRQLSGPRDGPAPGGATGVRRRVGLLAFSGDGTLLGGFAQGRHLELTVWNVGTGAPVCAFADPVQEPAGIAFHPSGRLAAVAVLTGDVLVLDLASGRVLRTLSDARMASEALRFSPDGRALLSASFDGVLQVWDAERWSVRRLPGVLGANALAVSPDGARAAVARSSFNPPDTPAEARLIDLRTGQATSSASAGIASTTDLAFTGPGRVRIAAAQGTTITVQELE